MVTQLVPSLTRRHHLPAVAARMAVPAVVDASGTTFETRW
jgi:hypothetical protein